jgi:hypothetical protein
MIIMVVGDDNCINTRQVINRDWRPMKAFRASKRKRRSSL